MAVAADSCITSPSLPVILTPPLPGTTLTSICSISPPASVYAKPLVRPISFCSSALLTRVLRRPEHLFEICFGDR